MNKFWFQVITTIVGTVAAVMIADAMKAKVAAIQSTQQNRMSAY